MSIEPIHPPTVEKGGRIYVLTLATHKNNCLFHDMDNILNLIWETGAKEISGPLINGLIVATYHEDTINRFPGGEPALVNRLQAILNRDYKREIRRRQDEAMK